jgi:hypothetical protein
MTPRRPGFERLLRVLRRRWPWLAVALACLLVALVAASTPERARHARISATLERAGSLSVRFARSPASTSSPVCGCIRHQPIGGWPHAMRRPALGWSREPIADVPPARGIVVPARLLRLAPATARYVRYDVYNSEPQGWNTLPSDSGLDATVRLVYLHRDATPTRATIFGRAGEDLRVVREARLVAQWLSVTSRQALYVASPSRRPVAAFSPPTGRSASIAYDSSVTDPDPTLRIATTWNTAPRQHRIDANRVPLLEVLGPHVYVWTRINRAAIPFKASQWAGSDIPSRVGAGVYHPEVASLFLPFVDQAPRGWAAYIGLRVNRGAFGMRLAAWATTAADAELRRRPHDRALPPHPGRLLLDVPRLVTQMHGLAAGRSRDQPGGVTVLHDVPVVDASGPRDPFDRPRFVNGFQMFERPAIGPGRGVDVYGALADLTVRDAAGSLVVAGRPIDFNASSTLELRDIHGRGVVGGHVLLPARPRGSNAQIDVQGEADARLNGEPLAMRRSWLGQQVSERRVSFYATILAAIFAGIALLRPRRQLTARERARRAGLPR